MDQTFPLSFLSFPVIDKILETIIPWYSKRALTYKNPGIFSQKKKLALPILPALLQSANKLPSTEATSGALHRLRCIWNAYGLGSCSLLSLTICHSSTLSVSTTGLHTSFSTFLSFPSWTIRMRRGVAAVPVAAALVRGIAVKVT